MKKEKVLLRRLIESAVEFKEVRPKIHELAREFLGEEEEYAPWCRKMRGGKKVVHLLGEKIPEEKYKEYIDELRKDLSLQIQILRESPKKKEVIGDCFGVQEIFGTEVCKNCGDTDLCKEECSIRESIQKEKEREMKEVRSAQMIETKPEDEEVEGEIRIKKWTIPYREGSASYIILKELLTAKEGRTQDELRQKLGGKGQSKIWDVILRGRMGYYVEEIEPGRYRAYVVTSVAPFLGEK